MRVYVCVWLWVLGLPRSFSKVVIAVLPNALYSVLSKSLPCAGWVKGSLGSLQGGGGIPDVPARSLCRC